MVENVNSVIVNCYCQPNLSIIEVTDFSVSTLMFSINILNLTSLRSANIENVEFKVHSMKIKVKKK